MGTCFTHHPPSVHDAPLVMAREEWEKFKKSVDRGFDAYETGSASDSLHEVPP